MRNGEWSKERLGRWEAEKFKAESSKLKGKIHRPDEISATEISLGRQRTQRTQRGLKHRARPIGRRSWGKEKQKLGSGEVGQVEDRKAQGSKRYDDGRLRIEAEAEKSVVSSLQPPTAEGLPNYFRPE